MILLLGVSSRAASFARALERRLRDQVADAEGIDGIVSATHTEGGARIAGNNREIVLRTLAGFFTHPNVGAVLAIQQGEEPLGNQSLERYLIEHGCPSDSLPHRFLTIGNSPERALDEAEAQVRRWVASVGMSRERRPVSELKIALQCGGSDAFSGVSGNPLAGAVARELIRCGGSAVLAETDELVGAESYILANTRNLDTARAFLECVRRFEERAAWHGQSLRDNATGGNKYRGLYNVVLKSIGAARKKDPAVCLDHVIEYGQRMKAPGFYFMDSPGNDLESIAGQVAAGCNLIFFITGNGSITNFPFVPTVKIITTSGRWELLSKDMDVNAGRYLDGEDFDALTEETFGLARRVASGKRAAGERAGHAQVSIWRDWCQTGPGGLDTVLARPRPDGRPLQAQAEAVPGLVFDLWDGPRGPAVDQVGLILPTSLCSGQIAERLARRLSDEQAGEDRAISRFVALVHTEGCGTSSGDNEDIYRRTVLSYLQHPFVRAALLLEHGCEHTHNGYFRHALRRAGMDPEAFGYASIQLDGGIEAVEDRVAHWFREALAGEDPGRRVRAGPGKLSLGMATSGRVSDDAAAALAAVTAAIVADGGTVVLPRDCDLTGRRSWRERLGLDSALRTTLAWGQRVTRPGLHLMENPAGHLVEAQTGLAAAGAQLLLICCDSGPVQAHPLVPVLQVGAVEEHAVPAADFDLVLSSAQHQDVQRALFDLLCRTASGLYAPRLSALAYTDFQVTRGLLGISL